MVYKPHRLLLKEFIIENYVDTQAPQRTLDHWSLFVGGKICPNLVLVSVLFFEAKPGI